MKYMEIPDISVKLRKNIKRLPLILCEDVSGSMEEKCDLMNQQLKNFFDIQSLEPEVCRRTDIEVIKFNKEVYESISTTLGKYTHEFQEAQARTSNIIESALCFAEKKQPVTVSQ